MNIFSKNAWVEHVAEGYVGHALARTSLSQGTQAWVLSIARALIFATLAGGLIAYQNGHISWSATGATFLLLLFRTVQQSPMPRDVWTDAQRIAAKELVEAQARLEKIAASADKPKNV